MSIVLCSEFEWSFLPLLGLKDNLNISVGNDSYTVATKTKTLLHMIIFG